NSVKFTSHGKIEVRVRAEYIAQNDPALRFEVRDTGCGVPADKSAMIFEAFQQAEGSMNRPYEGTGLGLAIARTLVQMMSGRIWLEQANPGAKFVFTAVFPRATEEAVRRKTESVTSAKAVQMVEAGMRVLVVEDNAENMILLRAYLENLPLSLDF